MLYKKKNTTEDPEKKTIYSSIYDKELETIRSAFGFDTNPEVFEADKIAQIRMDEEAKAKEKEKTKQNVA